MLTELKLKPCPFCGGEATLRKDQGEDLGTHAIVTWVQIGCDECDYSMAWPDYSTIASWNTRYKEDT